VPNNTRARRRSAESSQQPRGGARAPSAALRAASSPRSRRCARIRSTSSGSSMLAITSGARRSARTARSRSEHSFKTSRPVHAHGFGRRSLRCGGLLPCPRPSSSRDDRRSQRRMRRMRRKHSEKSRQVYPRRQHERCIISPRLRTTVHP
jgi:hypothetical protein